MNSAGDRANSLGRWEARAGHRREIGKGVGNWEHVDEGRAAG